MECVFFYLMFLMDVHRLISKSKCQTFTIEKSRLSQNLFGKKIWRNALALNSKKVQGIFGGTFILALLSFVNKMVSQITFNLFCSGDKKFLSEFRWKWGLFQGHNERFPKYLGQKSKIKKTETLFCRWKSNDNNDINFFMSL